MFNIAPKNLINTCLILAGILCAGMGIKGFLLSSHFIDGGVTGISMLLAEISGIPLFLLIPIMNLPFIIMGYFQMGWQFAVKSALAITGLSLCLLWVTYPDVTPDKLLTAVFGGFFLGAGIGLALRGGAVLDGTEIAALLISKTSALFRVGDVILLFNIFIFIAAAFILGVESALYSILTYVAASKMVNFLIYGIEEYTAIIIVSPEHERIRQKIIHECKRSVTLYKGAGGLTGNEQEILYCVVTRLEVGQIKTTVREIDPNAFVVIHPLSDAEGGTFIKSTIH